MKNWRFREVMKMPLYLATYNVGCFDPDAIKSLTGAYEEACAELRVPVESSSLNEIVAKKIIAHAIGSAIRSSYETQSLRNYGRKPFRGHDEMEKLTDRCALLIRPGLRSGNKVEARHGVG